MNKTEWKTKKGFRIMFEQYYNPLCNFAMTMMHSSHEAEDVVQEVFSKLWEKKDNIKADEKFKSYLFQSVRNKCFEVLRRKKKHNEVLDNIGHSDTENEQYFESLADEYVNMEMLQRSVRQLPTKCQEVFVLHVQKGLTFAQISEDKGISTKTVENHLRNAITRLKELIITHKRDFNF